MDGFSRREEPYQLNVFGEKIISCSCYKNHQNKVNSSTLTGYYRDGYCNTGSDDLGLHTVCAIMTREFLDYSKSVGNDLSTPIPKFNFSGLNHGDHWCLCAERWKQAYLDNKAPKIILKSTNIVTLSVIDIEILKRFDINYQGGN